MSERRGCEIRQASDGTVVRVNGSIDQELLDLLAKRVRDWADNRCDSLSAVPMPEIAQRIHGHETYRCGRQRGHDGPHRWPGDSGRCAEWTDEYPADVRAEDQTDESEAT